MLDFTDGPLPNLILSFGMRPAHLTANIAEGFPRSRAEFARYPQIYNVRSKYRGSLD